MADLAHRLPCFQRLLDNPLEAALITSDLLANVGEGRILRVLREIMVHARRNETPSRFGSE